jgi:hypothetical protein
MNMDLQARCDAIEECYEFMLAYAAQGVVNEAGSQSASELRTFLGRAETALADLADTCRSEVERGGFESADTDRAFIEVLDRDARSALAAVRLVMAQPSIRSQLIFSEVGPSDAFKDRFFRPCSQAPGDSTSSLAGGLSTSAGSGSTQWSSWRFTFCDQCCACCTSSA